MVKSTFCRCRLMSKNIGFYISFLLYQDLLDLIVCHSYKVSCPPGWHEAPSSWSCVFLEHSQLTTWGEARKRCSNDFDADLVKILDREKNKRLFGLFHSHISSAYIGLNGESGLGVKWLDEASPASYLNWDADAPKSKDDQICATIDFKREGKWTEETCNGTAAYICEMK
ncbi:hypothetical protein EGW08_008715, partial [Elysia chlorotica]